MNDISTSEDQKIPCRNTEGHYWSFNGTESWCFSPDCIGHPRFDKVRSEWVCVYCYVKKSEIIERDLD